MLVEQGIVATPTAGGHLGYDFAAALPQVKSAGQVPVPPRVREAILPRLASWKE